MSNLEANLRTETSGGSNNILRKQGMVPAVLYGGEEKNELISVSKKHLKTLLDQENFLSNVLKIKLILNFEHSKIRFLCSSFCAG